MKPGKRRSRKSKIDKTATIQAEESSGNVFADLGLPDPEGCLARAELTLRICDIIAERKLTQAAAAAILGIDQPKVSALMRGKLTGFSTGRLLRYLSALGSDVEIIIRPYVANQVGSVRIVPAAKAG
jgi:predicted XRE-type DNA-binding protein